MRLAGLAFGSADSIQWSIKDKPVDFFDIKGDIEVLFAPCAVRFVAAEHPAMHPGRCARIEVDGQAVGFAGELHPKWRQAYELPAAPLLFELDMAALTRRDVPAFTPIQRQQSVWRDLAVIAGETVTCEGLMSTIAMAHSGLVRSARLFDVYKPAVTPANMAAGERSLAVRLELLDDETPLTDDRIDAAVADVLATLSQRLGVRLRV